MRRGLGRMSMSMSGSLLDRPGFKISHTTGAFLRLDIVMRNTVHIGSSSNSVPAGVKVTVIHQKFRIARCSFRTRTYIPGTINPDP